MANKQKSQSVLTNKERGIKDKNNFENFEEYKQNFAKTNIGFNNNIGKIDNLENNNEIKINDLLIEDIKEEN